MKTQTNLGLWNTTLRYGFHFQHRNLRTLQIESFAHILDAPWFVTNKVIEGISKHRQLKKKPTTTALNTVFTSVLTQTT
jgi:hypothetical protein